MTPLSKWCVVTNTPVTDLVPLSRHIGLGDLQVYHRGPEGTVLPDAPSVTLDVRTLTPFPYEHATAFTSTLHLDADAVTVRISALNEDPVYYAVNRLRGRFAYFTDLLLAPLVLPALGLGVEFTGASPVHGHGTLLRGVDRLRHGSVSRTRRDRTGWLTETADEHDPLGDFHAPHRDDPLAAGEAQLDALAAEIARIHTTAPDGARYATLLSGGIDSGTVTYLAVASGLPVTPYSVATPWGDELDDAAELCAELGVALEAVHVAEDEIIASIPEAVRWLGGVDSETVEIALTATSVQRLAAVPADRVLLTGYGSDLINAGLYRPYRHRDELIGQVLASVDRTRLSNELSNRMPLAYGTTVRHPFWSWPVMRVALETAPECKVREGREKFHLRTAMATRVSESIAWRRKIAVHHGGGLQQGVRRRLEKEIGTTRHELLYQACFAELLERAAVGELEPTDPWLVLEGAVRRVRAR